MKWVDLGRFGVALRVYDPNDPTTPSNTATALIILDPEKLKSHIPDAEKSFVEVGFMRMADGAFNSPNSAFRYSELKNLFPDLQKSDFKEMTQDEVLYKPQQPDLTHKSQAQAFKHEDYGEKIGGARKDFHVKSLTVDDLANMTDVEKELLVNKANIWPAPDYRKLYQEDADPLVVLYKKEIRDALPATPVVKLRYSKKKVSNDVFVEAISAIKDCVDSIETTDDIHASYGKMLGLCWEVSKYNKDPVDLDSHHSYTSTNLMDNLGDRFSKKIRFFWDLWDEKITDFFNGRQKVYPTFFKDAVRKAYQYSGSFNDLETIKKSAAVQDVWSAISPALKKHFEAQKSVELGSNNPESPGISSDEPSKRDKAKAVQRPHLQHIERIGGRDPRSNDITAEDLANEFGFRAIEFGNWLPQDERQSVLNFAYDSFVDLTDAFNLPPKAISFDGQLALAFGSRGKVVQWLTMSLVDV